MASKMMDKKLFERCRSMYVAMCNGLESVDYLLTDWETDFVRDVGDRLIDCPTLSVTTIDKLSEIYRKCRPKMNEEHLGNARAD